MLTPRKTPSNRIEQHTFYTPHNTTTPGTGVVSPWMDDVVIQQKALSEKELERQRLKAQLVNITVQLREAVEENALREREISVLNKTRSSYQLQLCELNEEITLIRNSLSPLVNRSVGYCATPGNLRYGGKTYLDFSLFEDDLDLDDSIPDADFFDALFISPAKKVVSPPPPTIESFAPSDDFQLTDLLPLGSKCQHKAHIEGVKKRLSLTKDETAADNSTPESVTSSERIVEVPLRASLVDSIKLKLHPLGEIARNTMGGLNMRQKLRQSLSLNDKENISPDRVSLKIRPLLTSHLRLQWVESIRKVKATLGLWKDASPALPSLQRYEVQRAVTSASDDMVMEHCRVTFQTIGYTDRNNFITCIEDFPKSTLQFRVRAINLVDGKKGPWAEIETVETPDSFPITTERYLQYEGMPFDNNGVFYWIGTSGGRTPYQNPHISNELEVNTSCPWKEVKVECYVQYHDQDGNSDHCGLDLYPCSWVSFDLGYSRKLLPTHYCLRGRLYESEILKSWELQAKATDTGAWVTLRRHFNDTAVVYNDMHAVAAWPIEGIDQAYRYFRIRQMDQLALSDPSATMKFCGIELYGIIVDSERRHSLFII